MNNLSWLLYLADVLPSLAHVLGGAAIFGSIFMCALVIILILVKSDFTDSHTKAYYPEKYEKWKDREPHKLLKVLWLAIPFLIISTLIPSKETIYLIAGSEAGEYVVETPEAQEILDDIHKVIRHQLKEYAGEGKE